jgi:pyruvate kinase
MNKSFDVIATLNLHHLNEASLKGLANHGATILRINGSHVQPTEIGTYAQAIRRFLGNTVSILVDLPGNKIRTSLSQPIPIESGKTFTLTKDQLNYSEFLANLKPGQTILANDSLFRFTVKSVESGVATFLSHSSGLLKTGKGVHLLGEYPDLPILFQRDRDLIEASLQHSVNFLGLSFVRTSRDVDDVRALIKGKSIDVIVKIETKKAIENLDSILEKADRFLVDRGDLSCDVGLVNIDRFQKLILQRAKSKGRTIYFATQFFHSMVENPTPLIAEVCGFSDALQIGVDGIQLSEETAVGKYPLEILALIKGVRDAIASPLKICKEGPAPVLWLTGPSGAGKSTLAFSLKDELLARGLRVCLIDGDDYRAFQDEDLGYLKEDRIKNQKNIAFVAYQASLTFDLVIVSSLSPYREMRQFARRKNANFHEIYIRCSIDTCRKRDPKKHYEKGSQGGYQNFVGINETYEEPEQPELILDTDRLSVNASIETLKEYLF